jgi:hypothetical protein
MGRFSTGAITTGEAQRIELSWLIKQGWISKGGIISGTLSWNNGSEISINTEIKEGKGYIRLNYQNKRYTGEVNELDYKIQLTSIPSNLGRGKIWFFICPFTGRKTRILYKCYGSLYFKSRWAYSHRIYYSCQILSKNNFHNEKYFILERKLEKLQPLIRKKHYQGKETRILKRISILESKKEYHDYLRWEILSKSIHNSYAKKLLE